MDEINSQQYILLIGPEQETKVNITMSLDLETVM